MPGSAVKGRRGGEGGAGVKREDTSISLIETFGVLAIWLSLYDEYICLLELINDEYLEVFHDNMALTLSAPVSLLLIHAHPTTGNKSLRTNQLPAQRKQTNKNFLRRSGAK
mgnify:CR=1 FL=1